MASKEEQSILEITGRTSSQQISVIGGTGENGRCNLRLENPQIRVQAQPHPGVFTSFPYFVSPGWHLTVSQSFDLKSLARDSSMLPRDYIWRKPHYWTV